MDVLEWTTRHLAKLEGELLSSTTKTTFISLSVTSDCSSPRCPTFGRSFVCLIFYTGTEWLGFRTLFSSCPPISSLSKVFVCQTEVHLLSTVGLSPFTRLRKENSFGKFVKNSNTPIYEAMSKRSLKMIFGHSFFFSVASSFKRKRCCASFLQFRDGYSFWCR